MSLSPDLPAGERIYAIGDIHGRMDLFERIIGLIRTDNAARPPAQTRIILLGDIIDRGAYSAALVARCRALSERSDRFHVLKGNHEALMVDALRGSLPACAMWLAHGGIATLESWGVPADLIDRGVTPELIAAAREAISGADLAWLAALPLSYQAGNCLFVHAGIRPGVKLSRQSAHDFLWIRREFTESEAPLPVVVVHGHSELDVAPGLRNGRIALDTGAYRTDRLTAVGLEGGDHWLLGTTPPLVSRHAGDGLVHA